MDARASEEEFICICDEGYFGQHCEHLETRVEVTYEDIDIPFALFVYFIKVPGNVSHHRTTLLKKISSSDESVLFTIPIGPHLLFVEFENSYDMITLCRGMSLRSIQTQIKFSQKCPNVT